MKKGVTFDEILTLLLARVDVVSLSITLWSWRVQGATEENLRSVERSYGRALDALWEAQRHAGI